MRHDGVSGWYARLDRVLDDRPEQVRIWLEAWEGALRQSKPVAALLPEEWPTLPATLLTDPGHVLDHLIARHDAETDGRSPRGAHPTPPRLADAMVSSEMLKPPVEQMPAPQTHSLPLDALPPGFRQHLESLNLDHLNKDEVVEVDESVQLDIDAGRRTRTGISLPVADPATGGGLFPARLFKKHAEVSCDWDPQERLDDTRLLLRNLQLVDVSELSISATKSRLHLELVRYGLASLDEEGTDELLGREEVAELLNGVTLVADTLQDAWPFEESPLLLFANPPWLRIKDRFRGHPDGSRLRKELGEVLRGLLDENGEKRYSTMRGNVNLYRLFIERGLQVLQQDGRLRIVVPDSLLREQSSAPLRQLLVEGHGWENIWFFDEGNCLFPGISQGVVVISVVSRGRTDFLTTIGPLDRSDLRNDSNGVSAQVPRLALERERWNRWTRGEWGVPRLPRETEERRRLLEIIDELSHKPRLAEPLGWLTVDGNTARVRVGEVDQTSHSSSIKPWESGGRGTPFIRGVHFTDDGNGMISLRHPAFEKGIPSRASERQQARWTGELRPSGDPRLACQAIVNAHQQRRLRWVVMPSGCVLGNSVNHIELPITFQSNLSEKYGSLKDGLNWLCGHLNGDDLDDWARAWAANNNVNNYELEMLPLDILELEEGPIAAL